MNVLLVLAHPEPRSMSGAMAAVAREALTAQGHSVAFSDLYAMEFEPRSGRGNFRSLQDADHFKQQAEERHASETGGFADVLDEEMRKLEACDLMIWQFPLWWFGLPAILKGWVDRVFAAGRIYGGERIYAGGIKRGKHAMLSFTTGGPAPVFLPTGSQGDIMALLKPIHRGMLEFIGFSVLAPQIVYAPVRMSQDERIQALADWRARLAKIADETPIEVGRY